MKEKNKKKKKRNLKTNIINLLIIFIILIVVAILNYILFKTNVISYSREYPDGNIVCGFKAYRFGYTNKLIHMAIFIGFVITYLVLIIFTIRKWVSIKVKNKRKMIINNIVVVFVLIMILRIASIYLINDLKYGTEIQDNKYDKGFNVSYEIKDEC